MPLDCADDELVRQALGAAPLLLHKAVNAKQRQALASAIEQVKKGVGNLTMETQTSTGESALFEAAATGWQEGVEMLLAARADARTCNNRRRTALHVAVLAGNHRIVELLLAAKASPNAQEVDPDHDPRFSSQTMEETPDKHRTALHYAAELSALVCMRLLLAARAEVDARESKRVTPLQLCLGPLEDDAELEVGAGVRVDGLQKRPEWNGRLGTILAPEPSMAQGDRWPVLIEGNPDGVLLKSENLTRQTVEALELLLEARADVNLGSLQWSKSHTSVHEAATLKDSKALRMFLATTSADVNRQDDKQGFSPLHLACRARREDAVRLLLEARADPELQSVSGKAALELGEKNGLSEAALALLRGEVTSSGPAAEEGKAGYPQTLDSLTPEQRALLFID